MTTRVQLGDTAVGQLAAEGVDGLLEAKAKIQRVVEILYAAIYDPGTPDLAAVEAELGIPTGKGQQVFDLLNGAKTALEATQIVALREIDQG